MLTSTGDSMFAGILILGLLFILIYYSILLVWSIRLFWEKDNPERNTLGQSSILFVINILPFIVIIYFCL